MAVGELTDRMLLGTLRLGRRRGPGLSRWRTGAIGLVVCVMALTGCNSGGGGGGDGPIPTVIIIPPGDVAKGQSVQLFAMVVDAGPGVVWSMQSGAAYGTVTPNGVFTAPLTVPDGPAIVRATSRDDSRGTAVASINVVVGWTTSGPGAVTVNPNQALRPTGPAGTANTFSGGQRSVAVSGSTVYAVWNEDVTGDDDIYLAVSRDRGATFGAPIRVNYDDITTAPQLAPSVAVDASGRAVIAWIDARNDPDPAPNNHGYDIYVAEATISGSGTVTLGPNQRVTTHSNGPACDYDDQNVPCDPSVALAVSLGGDVYMAWTDASSGFDMDVLLTKGTRLVSEAFQFAFAPATPVHAYLTSDQSRPSVAVDSAGFVLVAWNDPRSGDQDIYWSRGQFAANGAVTWTAQDVMVNLQTADDQVSPSVAFDQDGVPYVAWSQQVGASERRKLYFARGAKSNLVVAGNVDVLPTVDADQNFPSLSVIGTDATIAFADNRGCLPPACPFDPVNPKGTGPTDVYLVRSVDGGATFGDSLRVNDDPAGTALHGRASLAV
ncbi:MAG TPA: hypothetical protein VFN94_01285, partial [Nitrospiria bacterium]|nr:hypothetical protein [Nitrospiria bacterium]